MYTSKYHFSIIPVSNFFQTMFDPITASKILEDSEKMDFIGMNVEKRYKFYQKDYWIEKLKTRYTP